MYYFYRIGNVILKVPLKYQAQKKKKTIELQAQYLIKIKLLLVRKLLLSFRNLSNKLQAKIINIFQFP